MAIVFVKTGVKMNNTFLSILKLSAPLLFASLGALCTEYAGVLAVFMEGAITLSGFLCIAFTVYTGSKIYGFLLAAILTVFIMSAAALFTSKTKANAFLTGLALNLFAEGICSSALQYFFKGSSVIAFSDFPTAMNIDSSNTMFPFFTAVFFAVLLFLFLNFTVYGLNLKYCGKFPQVLIVRGVNPEIYKIASWAAAGGFASCAGAVIVFRIAAYTPHFSAGKGWTALAVVFLGFKNPILCIAAVLIFSSLEYAVNIFQTSLFPPSLMLSLPYIIALFCFIIPNIFSFNPFIRKHEKNNFV